jgi:pimeloyl-ACP methyl ester carboxylesterase
MPNIQAGSLQLNYEIFGQGYPLLLIMGFGMPGAAWAPMLPFLGGSKCIYFVIAVPAHPISPTGHTRSPRWPTMRPTC